ncbi:hypothetical protein GCM10020331_097880 [Ectobacillus funiculus]
MSGKVGWAILPKGKKGYANSFGGTGLAINKYASEKEQKGSMVISYMGYSTANTIYAFCNQLLVDQHPPVILCMHFLTSKKRLAGWDAGFKNYLIYYQ